MNIITNNQNYNQSFTAKYIKPAMIQERSFLKYKPFEASFVEFDMRNDTDKDALRKFIKDCKYPPVIRNLVDNLTGTNGHVVGITKQKDNFEKPAPEDILGVMQYLDYDEGEYYISNLQTKPQYKKKIFNFLRKYRGIGKANIDRIKELDSCESIRLKPDRKAIPFYFLQDFFFGNDVFMFWHKNF